ncbi:MAG: DUF2752 domain-containing protein [Sedimentisphaerales bacterium]|nr:DUF2752 domain-containing protein [Sedimentisphaerales bacterium]
MTYKILKNNALSPEAQSGPWSGVVCVSRKSRVIAVFVAAGCLAVLICARILVPASAGYGTHQQLHLPPCGMLQRTGYPCPTCGMTTAFALVTRGRIFTAFQTQPAGAVFALAAVVILITAGYTICTSRLPKIITRLNIERLLIAAVVLIVLAWALLCLAAGLKQ